MEYHTKRMENHPRLCGNKSCEDTVGIGCYLVGIRTGANFRSSVDNLGPMPLKFNGIQISRDTAERRSFPEAVEVLEELESIGEGSCDRSNSVVGLDKFV